jgi:hypothetical protein
VIKIDVVVGRGNLFTAGDIAIWLICSQPAMLKKPPSAETLTDSYYVVIA